jgi:hypothetical protein
VQEKLRAKTFKHGFFEYFMLKDLDEIEVSASLKQVTDDPKLLESKTSAIVSLWKLCNEERDNPKLEYVKHVTIKDAVFNLASQEAKEGKQLELKENGEEKDGDLKLPEFLYLVKGTTRIVFV